jgi:hypothetical protein
VEPDITIAIEKARQIYVQAKLQPKDIGYNPILLPHFIVPV